ncbi:hypothetical protein [Photobacterium nomapromontoriensis]|uniref:hypothetical protein n=1 Tax=Photobacterium nomapromontoriensis TaxID=2910237 RepID=UPI003D0DDE66
MAQWVIDDHHNIDAWLLGLIDVETDSRKPTLKWNGVTPKPAAVVANRATMPSPN